MQSFRHGTLLLGVGVGVFQTLLQVQAVDDKISLNHFGRVGLVMTIIFTIAFGFLIVILVKRQILRMLLISRRGPHSIVGSDAPRSLAREIDAQLKRIAFLRIEPRMLSEQFNKPQEDSNFDSPPDQYTRSYKYRMKAMDKMTELDDLICSISHKYDRPKGQSVRNYLKMLQRPPYRVIRGGDDTIDKLAEMYDHARFEPKEFSNIQYRKFAYLVEQLKDRVRLYVNVPGSLIINSSSKQPKKQPLSSTKVASPGTDVKTTEQPDSPEITGTAQTTPRKSTDRQPTRTEGTVEQADSQVEMSGDVVMKEAVVVVEDRGVKMSESGAAMNVL